MILKALTLRVPNFLTFGDLSVITCASRVMPTLQSTHSIKTG